MELDKKLKEKLSCIKSNSHGVNHFDVLKALSKALRKTEETYFEIADKMAEEKPKLAFDGLLCFGHVNEMRKCLLDACR